MPNILMASVHILICKFYSIVETKFSLTLMILHSHFPCLSFLFLEDCYLNDISLTLLYVLILFLEDLMIDGILINMMDYAKI